MSVMTAMNRRQFLGTTAALAGFFTNHSKMFYKIFYRYFFKCKYLTTRYNCFRYFMNFSCC